MATKKERKKSGEPLPIYDSGFITVNGIRKPIMRICLHDYTFRLNFKLVVSDWMVAYYLVQRHTWGWGSRPDYDTYWYDRNVTHMSPEKMLKSRRVNVLIAEELVSI